MNNFTLGGAFDYSFSKSMVCPCRSRYILSKSPSLIVPIKVPVFLSTTGIVSPIKFAAASMACCNEASDFMFNASVSVYFMMASLGFANINYFR